MNNFKELLNKIDLSLKIEYLMSYKKADIYLLREDKLNFSYGGNKLRLAIELLFDFYKKDCDIILSYGSLESNFNRIISAFCNKLNIPCYILTSLNDKEYLQIKNKTRKKCLNEKISDALGAKRYFCKKTKVQEKLIEIIDFLKKENKKVYYIYGDIYGKGNEAILQNAYYKVYKELEKNEPEFDNIVLPYGTGMTYYGLAKAKKESNNRINLYGISIARNEILNDNLEHNYILNKYINKAYANIDEELKNFIISINKKYDINLDPIYTGKAFYGLIKEIDNNNIIGKTLFIHTGAYPIYLDFVEENCTDK